MAIDAGVPVLTDGVVTLRAHVLDDVDAVTEMCRDPEFARWTTVPLPYEKAMAEEFIAETVPDAWRAQDWFCWAIESADDQGRPRYAGNLAVRSRPRPDLGYGLHPWARGRAVMSRAVRLATRWAFDTLGMPVMHWECHAGNFDSWRVAWACGFSFEGTASAYSPQRGELRDAWLGVLRPDAPQTPATRWLEVPVLEGARVRLRPYADDDLAPMVEACRDPRTRHWLPHMPDPYTLDTARDYVRQCRLDASLGRRVTWAVADRDSDAFMADVGIFGLTKPLCPGSGEVGYVAHPSARGRGMVTEAVRLALGHAFAPVADGGLGCHRLQLGASAGNAASRHVAEAAGFSQVGYFRLDGLLGDGTYEDGAWYDVLAAGAQETQTSKAR
jgi:RimJ/RimL family protein N-acetyltransferase